MLQEHSSGRFNRAECIQKLNLSSMKCGIFAAFTCKICIKRVKLGTLGNVIVQMEFHTLTDYVDVRYCRA